MLSKYISSSSSSSSMPRSFTSLTLFGTLFALCFFSILYIHTQQNVYINGLNELLSSKAPTSKASQDNPITTSNKAIDLDPTTNEDIDEDSNDLTPKQEENSNNKNEDSAVEPKVNPSIPTKKDTIELDVNTKLDNTTKKAPPPSIQVNVDKVNVDDLVDEDDDDGEDTYPNEKETLWAPQNVPIPKRIEWFMQLLPKIRVLTSTPKTKLFDERVQKFFNDNQCSTKFYMTWIAPAFRFKKREIFALESIFKSHPKACVLILSASLDSKLGRRILEPLKTRGYAIFAAKPDLAFLSRDTPAQPFLEKLMSGKVDPGRVRITQNLSNLLRLLVVYQYGGIYLDVDFIILKDISGLRNSVGIQTINEKTGEWTSLNNAVLIFDAKHPLMYQFIASFAARFNGSVWGNNGPLMINRVVKSVLFDTNYKFNILSRMAFYPVDWFGIFDFFEKPKNETMKKWVDDKYQLYEKVSFGIHLWNTATRPLKIPHGSLIGKLISDHCVICEDIYDDEIQKA